MSVQLLIERVVADMAAADVPFGDGGKPDGTESGRWAVGWPDAGVERAHTLGNVRGRVALVLTVHCVSRSAEGARHVKDVLTTVLLALAGQVVAGQRIAHPEQLSARALVRDDDVKPPLFSQAVEWRLVMTPTTRGAP